MTSKEKISAVDLASLRVIRYPDPRLMEVCTPVDEVDEKLEQLASRMFDLMEQARGVGLAAPQVGVTIRMFIGEVAGPESRCVYINPKIIQADGEQNGDEGCLSFPGIFSKTKRAQRAVIEATGLDGKRFRQEGFDLLARLFQHESDHLDGRLLVHRMGTVAKLSNRRALRELEEQYADSMGRKV